jgi:hypothetical protein
MMDQPAKGVTVIKGIKTRIRRDNPDTETKERGETSLLFRSYRSFIFLITVTFFLQNPVKPSIRKAPDRFRGLSYFHNSFRKTNLPITPLCTNLPVTLLFGEI